MVARGNTSKDTKVPRGTDAPKSNQSEDSAGLFQSLLNLVVDTVRSIDSVFTSATTQAESSLQENYTAMQDSISEPRLSVALRLLRPAQMVFTIAQAAVVILCWVQIQNRKTR